MSKGIQTHEATGIILKEAKIDDKIIPVVEWVNSLECYTTACCQGCDESDHCCISHPYIIFVCWGLESLEHIISIVKSFNFSYKDKYKNPVSLELQTSLVSHFALSRKISLSMSNEEILPLFCNHIKGMAEINKDTIPNDTLPDINLL